MFVVIIYTLLWKLSADMPNQSFVCLLARAVLLFFFCVWSVCIVPFPCFWLSVPVQSIVWKVSSLK